MSVTINAENVVQIPCQAESYKCVPISNRGLPVSIKLAIDNTMDNGRSHIVLPVFEIDGLKVRCELIVNENGMSLCIKSYKMLMYDTLPEHDKSFVLRQLLFRKTYIKKLTKYTLKDYETVIKHMNHDISVMKFDRLNGVFVTPQISHPREAPYVRSNIEMLNGVPCDEKQPENCSVCLEVTKSTTPCGHKLCVECWCLLKTNGIELPCPICRCDLFQSRKIGVDDNIVKYDIANNEDDDYDPEDDGDDESEEEEETEEEREDRRWLAFRSR